jgi:trehalose-6-phosphate synthase
MVTSDADGLHLGPVEWLATRIYHEKNRLVNVILSNGAGVSEYFPHAMTFNPGDHQRLTTFLCQTTTETSADQATRSDAIKRDFHEGHAQGSGYLAR